MAPGIHSSILITLILIYIPPYVQTYNVYYSPSPSSVEFKFQLTRSHSSSSLSVIDLAIQITNSAKETNEQPVSPLICQTWLFSSYTRVHHHDLIYSNDAISASFSKIPLDSLYPVLFLTKVHDHDPNATSFYHDAILATNLNLVSTNTGDHTRPFSYTNYEFSEDDLVRSSQLGVMRFGINCVSALIVGATNVRESFELTSAVIERKLAKPHQDYFMYILGLTTGQSQEHVGETADLIDQILWRSKTMEDMKYKYVFSFKNSSHVGNKQNEVIIANLYNVCERSGERLGLFSPRCLSHVVNRHYKISACNVPPLIRFENYPDGSLKRGMGMALMMFLAASKNYNFTVEVKQAGFNGSSGFKKKDTGIWYGAVGEVFKREADIAFAGKLTRPAPCLAYGSLIICVVYVVGITVHRHTIIDPSHCQTLFTRMFFIKKPSLKKSWLSVLWPMRTHIWIMTLVTVSLILPIYYWAALIYFNRAQGTRPKYLFLEVVDILYRILMEQSATARPWKGSRIRLLILLWTGFCLVLETGYRSKLVTFLTFLEREEIPKTHLELSLSDYKLFFRTYNGAALQFTLTSPHPMHKRILQKSVFSNHSYECIQLALMTEQSACLDYGLNGQYGITTNASLSTNQNSEVIVGSRDTDMAFNIIWGFRKGSPWRASFDRVVLNTLAAGLYNKWKTDEWRESRVKGSQYLKSLKTSPLRDKIESIMSEMVVGPKSLGRDSLEGTYVIYCMGITISLIGWLAEHSHFFIMKYKEKQRRHFKDVRHLQTNQISSQ